MKTIFTILLISLTFQVMSQTDSVKPKQKAGQDDIYFVPASTQKADTTQDPQDNFKSEDNLLIWQKIFETKLSFRQLVDKINGAGLINDFRVDEGKISGDLRPTDFDNKGAGIGDMGTTLYIGYSRLSGFIVVDYKEGRYRVTARRMILILKMPFPTLLGTYLPVGTVISAETMAFKSSKKNAGKFTNAFLGDQSKIWNYTLQSKFEFKEVKQDSW